MASTVPAASSSPKRVACLLRMVSVVRNKQALLSDVSVVIHPGEMVVVSGENGAGKTSLLRVLAGLMPISAGEGTVLGERLPLSASSRRRISAALDEPAFWPWMSAFSVVKTTADLSGRARPDIARLLGELGLDHTRFGLSPSKRVGKFSQGMRKRLQVACALAPEADLLLLDEPTATLDPDGSALVWAAVERRHKEGVTVIVATHDPDAGAAFGARRLKLEFGRVADDSSPRRLIAAR